MTGPVLEHADLIAAGYETIGGRSYDIPVCPHGCCPAAVCDFVQDCHTHQGKT